MLAGTYKHSEETRKKISDANRGRPMSAEARRNISLARIGNKNALGYHHTQETKDKISRANTGRIRKPQPKSIETKKKIRESWTPERREANRLRMLKEQGPTHRAWRGGKCLNGEGYVKVYAPEHPYRTSDNRVMEHRLVAEKALGKFLPLSRPVHHVNLDPADNRPCNLVICDNGSYHRVIQTRTRWLANSLWRDFINKEFAAYPPKKSNRTDGGFREFHPRKT